MPVFLGFRDHDTAHPDVWVCLMIPAALAVRGVANTKGHIGQGGRDRTTPMTTIPTKAALH